jgi:hypothetical protein
MMWNRISKLALVALLWLSLWGLDCPQAIAAIHQYPEGADQVMYRSLQTLRDRTDQAWQIVLYKRLKAGQVSDFHLRLVGFPGTEINHNGALVISSRSGQTTTAPDVTLADPPLTPNAVEYDLRSFMSTLDADIALEVVVPLKTRNAELVLPPFIVQEWRKLKDVGF